MKRRLISLVIREMKDKNTMRCHYAPTRMAETKKTDQAFVRL